MTDFAELIATSNFSFLEGASHGEELVRQAKALGLSAIAIADRNTLAGVVRAHVAAKEAGMKVSETGCLSATYPILTHPQAFRSLMTQRANIPYRR